MVSTEKRWIVQPNAPVNEVDELAKVLSIEPTLANLLVQRGIRTFDEAKLFFRPSLEHLHDPFLMADMEKACTRLIRAVKQNEKILVYGDYDVDGTTAVSLVYTFLRARGAQVDFYIPDRYREGYGVSTQGIAYAAAQNCQLIITLDCGIKAHSALALAQEKGMDVIVCDHHLPDQLPPAHAVLDPKRPDCSYPYDELSGCGVGFKLLQAYAQREGLPFTELESYLDLLVVSIASDIVPITGENRVLAFFGLQQINTSPRLGLKSLLDLASKKKNISIGDIVFQIGPRINAAGRIESGKQAVELLITEDEAVAIRIASRIDDNNAERKQLDAEMTSEALAMIAESDALSAARSTVLYKKDWHKGVIGIVCSRVIETYHRPTILLTFSNGKVTGSARSVGKFDIHAAIDQCSDLLEQFGGHKFAAGLTMKEENVAAFCTRFEEVVSQSLALQDAVPEVVADATLRLEDITPKFFRILNQLAPFGPGNRRPVFLSEHLSDTGWAKVVGTKHLRMNLMQEGAPPHFNAIGFNLGRHQREVIRQTPFRMLYTIEENEWQGRTTLQLNAKDIKFD